MKATLQDIDMWKTECGGEVVYTPGYRNSKGSITLINKKFDVHNVAYESVSKCILSISSYFIHINIES